MKLAEATFFKKEKNFTFMRWNTLLCQRLWNHKEKTKQNKEIVYF